MACFAAWVGPMGPKAPKIGCWYGWLRCAMVISSVPKSAQGWLKCDITAVLNSWYLVINHHMKTPSANWITWTRTFTWTLYSLQTWWFPVALPPLESMQSVVHSKLDNWVLVCSTIIDHEIRTIFRMIFYWTPQHILLLLFVFTLH